jgi:TusA-related sulfurtransferase
MSATGDFSVTGVTPAAVVDGRSLNGSTGLLMLVRNAAARAAAGDVIEIRTSDPGAHEDIAAWCRLSRCETVATLDAGDHIRHLIRVAGAGVEEPDWGQRLPRRDGGRVDTRDWFTGRAGDVPGEAPTYLGFVPRGAVAEAGTPAYPFSLNRKEDVWADSLPDLYEQAKSQQWNATTDIAWDRLKPLPDDVERAVCQLMTFLAENEYAALYIPAKFLPRINAQYVEAVLFLGTMIADEARHIEAFTKRALANGGGLQYSAALTEWSLYGLLVQEDYFRSSFLLHVLGEGTFLDLLEFIEQHAPDPVTADVVRRARLDEGRHVAYGIAHVRERLTAEPQRAQDLVGAAEERSAALQATSGANPMVKEALAVLASRAHGGMAGGLRATDELYRSMHHHRIRRMLQIGLDRDTAEAISQLHTPNFM